MFAYILRAHAVPDEQGKEFFRRFKETTGLLHAFDLQSGEDAEDNVVVAIWESREAAQRYLEHSSLRREVGQAIPSVTRTMYTVLDSK